jgi:hypothetical protein
MHAADEQWYSDFEVRGDQGQQWFMKAHKLVRVTLEELDPAQSTDDAMVYVATSREDIVLGYYYDAYDRNRPRDRPTQSLKLRRSAALTAIRPTDIVTTVTMHPYYDNAQPTAGVFLLNRYEHFPRYTQWHGDKGRLILARRCVPLGAMEEQIVVRILAHRKDDNGHLQYQVCWNYPKKGAYNCSLFYFRLEVTLLACAFPPGQCTNLSTAF